MDYVWVVCESWDQEESKHPILEVHVTRETARAAVAWWKLEGFKTGIGKCMVIRG